MTRNPDRVVHTDTLHEVDRKMRDLLVAFLPVCSEHNELHGIIALTDLQRDVGGGDPAGVTAALLATAPPVTVGVNDAADHLPDLMAQHRVWLLPVLDGRRLVGVIHYPGHIQPVQRPDAGQRAQGRSLVVAPRPRVSARENSPAGRPGLFTADPALTQRPRGRRLAASGQPRSRRYWANCSL